MNVFCVKEVLSFAKQYAMKNGPIFLEADCYRYHGHSMSDPGISYRTKDEVNKVKEQSDPIEHIRKCILDNNVLDEGQLGAIEKKIKVKIEEVVEEIYKDPYPEEKELYTEIYANREQNSFIRAVEYEKSINKP